jgi:hypothetical protein
MAKSILIFVISNLKKRGLNCSGLLVVAIHEVGMDRTGMTARRRGSSGGLLMNSDRSSRRVMNIHLELVSRLSRDSVTEVVQETNP